MVRFVIGSAVGKRGPLSARGEPALRRTLSQGIAIAAAAVTITAGVAGCGAVKQLSAKQQVSKALSSFEDADSASFTVRLDSTVKDIAAISKAENDPMSASDRKLLGEVLAGDVQYSIHAPDGKHLSDSATTSQQIPDLNALLGDPQKFGTYLKQAGDVAIAVRLSGDSLAEFRFKDGVLYARASVPKIMELAGQDASQVDAALTNLPPSLAPLRKAAHGQWISVDVQALMQALKQSGALNALPTAQPSPTVDAGAVQKLFTDLKAAYRDKATITKLGDTDRGQEYRLTAPAKQIAGAVQDDVIKLVGTASASDVRRSIAEIPDKPISMNLWSKNDKLSGVALDLTQFMKKTAPGAKLTLDVGVNVGSGEIEKPSGATAIDVSAVMKELGGAMGR